MYSDFELRFLILEHLVDLSKKNPNKSVFSAEEIANALKVDYKAVMFHIRYFIGGYQLGLKIREIINFN